MRTLAKVGFSQSYTYFTWKNSRWELDRVRQRAGRQRASRSTSGRTSSSTRPTSSPRSCQLGGPAAFASRARPRRDALPDLRHLLGLRALRERAGRAPGSRGVPGLREVRAQASARSTARCCRSSRRLNAIRREHPALQHLRQRPFLETENDALIAYAKRTRRRRGDRVVNLDPHSAQEGVVRRARRPRPAAGLRRRATCSAASRFDWRIGRNYVRLEPGAGARPAAVDARERHRSAPPLVRDQPAVVQDGGLLRDPPARLLRRQRRRLRRLPRADREARLPAVAGHRLHLAAADVRLAAARRRLRHRRLLRRAPRLRRRSTTSARSSRRPTSAASASSPTSS